MNNVAKLPQWAQNKIRQLQSERDAAVNSLNRHLDAQTPSKVYSDEMICTGERPSPSFKRHYFQSDKVVVEHAGIRLTVRAYSKDHIGLQWGAISGLLDELAFIPEAFQQARIKVVNNQPPP